MPTGVKFYFKDGGPKGKMDQWWKPENAMVAKRVGKTNQWKASSVCVCACAVNGSPLASLLRHQTGHPANVSWRTLLLAGLPCTGETQLQAPHWQQIQGPRVWNVWQICRSPSCCCQMVLTRHREGSSVFSRHHLSPCPDSDRCGVVVPCPHRFLQVFVLDKGADGKGFTTRHKHQDRCTNEHGDNLVDYTGAVYQQNYDAFAAGKCATSCPAKWKPWPDPPKTYSFFDCRKEAKKVQFWPVLCVRVFVALSQRGLCFRASHHTRGRSKQSVADLHSTTSVERPGLFAVACCLLRFLSPRVRHSQHPRFLLPRAHRSQQVPRQQQNPERCGWTFPESQAVDGRQVRD